MPWIYAAALTALLVAPAFAQRQKPPDAPEPAAEEVRIEEAVIVSATRTEKRVEDQPMRVEVVPADEVQEKLMMTPGDVSMLLNEMNGLRVQTTSPSLGGRQRAHPGASGPLHAGAR